jgi:hypothetical protein
MASNQFVELVEVCLGLRSGEVWGRVSGMKLLRIVCLAVLAGSAALLTSCSQAGGLASGVATAAQAAPGGLMSTLNRTFQSVGRTVTY